MANLLEPLAQLVAVETMVDWNLKVEDMQATPSELAHSELAMKVMHSYRAVKRQVNQFLTGRTVLLAHH
jgi:hypothetical protein